MAEERGYTPEELGLIPKAKAQRGYTPEELGLIPKTTAQRGYTPEELGIIPKKIESEPRPEDQSIFRQVADVPLQLGKGVVSGVRMIADAFGAGSETSKVLKGGEDYLAGLMSAQSKQDSKEIARIMKEAEDKGVLDQVIAGIKALSVAPVDTLVNALGTSAPAIIGSLAAIPAGALAVGAASAGIGAAMGAGTIKGGIYDAVKEELSKTDMPKDQIEARAKLAQDYDGKNLDMILTGAAIGTLGATTGIEPALAKMFSKNIIQKTAKEKAAEETRNIAKQGIKKYATKEGLTEFATESTQAGQEQVAGNLALQREGIDTPLMRGVISNAVLEGIAALGMGAGIGARTAYKAKQEINKLDQGSQEVVKDTIKDIATKDLQEKGVSVGEDELDTLINDILNTEPKKENKNVPTDNTSVVAGTNQPSVPISTDTTGQVAATGAGEPAPTDVGGAGQAIAGAGNREVDESGALEEADKKRQEQIANAESIAGLNFLNVIDQMKEFESPEQAFDSALTNIIDTLKDEGVKDPTIYDAAANKLNALIREYEGRAKNDAQEEQEAARLKDIEDRRIAIENAFQEYNAPNDTPDSNPEKSHPLYEKIGLPMGPARENAKNDKIPLEDAVLLKRMIIKNIESGLERGLTRQAIIDQIYTLTQNGLTPNQYTPINDYLTEKGVKEGPTVGNTTEAGTTEPLSRELKQRATMFIADMEQGLSTPKTKDINSLARDLGLVVKKGQKPEVTVQKIKEAIQYSPNETPVGNVTEAGTAETSKKPIIDDKGAFIPGATKNDLFPASATFKQTEPDTDLHDEVGDATFISGFNVQPDLQGKGYGRKLLNTIIEWADTNGKRLALNPAASGGLTQEQLKDWYERNGFKYVGDYMVREPKGKTTEAGTTEVSTTTKTEEQLEDEREEAFREKAEAELSESDIGKALQRIEDEDRTETKAQLRAFTNKLEKDGTLDDVEDIREALSDREVDAYDVLDIIREQLEDAKETAIEELMDEYRNDYEISADEQASLQEKLAQELGQTKPSREMSEDEKKLRTVQKTPDITDLSQELQSAPEVQKYHFAFNAWLDSMQSGADADTQRRLRDDLVKAKQALPQEHPAAYKETVNGKSGIKKAGGTDDISGNIHPTVYDAIQNNDIKGVLTALFKTSSGYTRNLAQRLLELNLNTDIFFDNQQKILEKYVKAADHALNRVQNYLETLYPGALIYVDQSLMPSPILDTANAYKFLKEKTNIDFNGVEEELAYVIKAYENAAKAYSVPGFYIGGSINALNLNTNIPQYFGTTTNHVLLHEILHAATQWAINNRDKLTRQQLYALDDLTALFNYAKERSKDGSEYGFTDLDEFVAEAFSNKKFQEFLKSLKYEMEGPKTIWSRFMQVVGRLIGTNNVLFYTLANTEVLFSANSGDTGFSLSLMARPKKNTPKPPKPIATTKVNTKENFGNAIINGAISGRVTWKDLNKNNLVTWLKSLKDQYRKYLLGGLTLDQLTDMVGEALPQFKAYRNEKDSMLNTRNKIIGESEKAVSLWTNLQAKHPKLAKMLDTLMIEATFAKVDPDPKGKGHDPKALKNTKAGKQAQAAWDAVMADPNNADAIEIYREVRNFYERRMKEYIFVVLKRLALNLKANNLTPAEIKKKLDDKFNSINDDIIKPYFPIKRFGEFWLQIGKGKGNTTFMQFEDAASRNMAMDAEIKRLTKEKMAANSALTLEKAIEAAEDEISAGNSFSTQINTRLADAGHLDDIVDLINKTTATVQIGNAVDKVESLRENLVDGFNQWYLEMMPTQSIRKMFIHRKNVPGLSGDMFRAFNESRQRIAYQRSRFEHLPELFSHVKLANDSLKFMPLDEQIKWRDYVRELELNLKTAVLEPPKQSKLTTWATQAGFLYYLTSPASAVVNIMAIPGIYTPAAVPKYGAANVAKSLAKYNRLLFATAKGKKLLTDEKTGRWTLMPSLARSNLATITSVGDKADLPAGKNLADVYDAGVRLNVIDTTQAHDNAAMAEMSSNKYTGRWQKTMYYASLPFHAAEKYNRETTFMASFDMAYRKYINEKKYTKEKAYEAAIMDARNLVQETMFNYETINKPRYFRGDTRNIILQFKQYPQHMSVLLWRTFEKAWRSDIEGEMTRYERQIANSPANIQKDLKDKKRKELEQIRKESRQQFMGMLAMTFTTAGMSGLPMFFIFEGVAKAMHSLFGDDDDDDFDVDNWFKNWCNDTFGGVAGHAINRGLLTAATGVNFADRMSINLNDMWFPDARPSNDEVTSLTNRLISMMGPTVSIGVKAMDALHKYRAGDTERAAETIMPSAIKNVMVGTRYLVEGEAKTATGATLVDQVNVAQALTQMLGFTPEEIALAQKKTFGEKSAAVKIELKRANISNAFYLAIQAGDSDMLTKAIEKIQKFNKAYPTYPIDGEDLVNSVKKHYSDLSKANLHGGVNINKNLYPILDQIYR